MKKTETIAEFLARGGTIARVSPSQDLSKNEKVKPTNNGPVTIMSMDEADLYYGEFKEKKAKSKQPKTNGFSSVKEYKDALPEELRKKYHGDSEDEEEDL